MLCTTRVQPNTNPVICDVKLIENLIINTWRDIWINTFNIIFNNAERESFVDNGRGAPCVQTTNNASSHF
jgi:hypothetical protein